MIYLEAIAEELVVEELVDDQDLVEDMKEVKDTINFPLAEKEK